MATATKATKRAPATDADIDGFLALVADEDRKTLKRCTAKKVAALGYSDVREGGRIWERAQREVARDLLNADLRLSDIEWSED